MAEELKSEAEVISQILFKYAYPRPVVCNDNGEEIIIFVSHCNDGKIIAYRPSTKTYKEIMKYPNSKLKSHSIALNTLTKRLYIYDGKLPAFHILSIGSTSGNNNDINANSNKLIKQYNIPKLGVGISSFYVQKYNQYHIIGGAKMKQQHYVWNHNTQKFELYSSFPQKLANIQFLFIESKDIFIIFGDSLGQNMYSLACRADLKWQQRKWVKMDRNFIFSTGAPVICKNFGCCLYKDEYILTLGGIQKSTVGYIRESRSVDVYICDIKNQFKWDKSEFLAPSANIYAVMLNKEGMLHMFEKFGRILNHYKVDVNSIISAPKSDAVYTAPKNRIRRYEAVSVDTGVLDDKLDLILKLMKNMTKEIVSLKQDVNDIKEHLGLKNKNIGVLEMDPESLPIYEGAKQTFQ